MNSKIIGLVLSGGGMRGMAHIGVIKAMRELGIKADRISGTSMGALVGALYAADFSTDQMIAIFESISIFSFRNYTYGKPGLIHTLKFERHFHDYFTENSFESLQRELVVNSTNIITGKHRTFRKGNLFLPLLSSIAYPGIMTPVEIQAELYVDGGITNNFPIEPIRYECDFIIGSYVNPLKQIQAKQLSNSFAVLERVVQTMMYTMEEPSFVWSDVFIMPSSLSVFPLFSLKHINEAVDIGYQGAMKQLQPIVS